MFKLIFFLLIFQRAITLCPAIIEVCLSGDKEYTDLQMALNSAAEDDTIRVYPGTYIGPFTMSQDIGLTIESLYPSTNDTTYIHTTKLTAPYLENILTITYTEIDPEGRPHPPVTVNGFSISNDLADTIQSFLHPGSGGLVIYLRSANVLNNIFTNHHGGRNGNALALTSPSTVINTMYLENNQIYNNLCLALSSGLTISTSGPVIFSTQNRNSIYNNVSNAGKDIAIRLILSDLSIYLDKGSRIMTEPDGNYIFNDHIAVDDVNVTVDILRETLPPLVNHDLFVAPWGDDNNSGLNPAEPLRSMYLASTIIASDSLNPKTIHLAPGIYNPIEGKVNSIFLPDWTNLVGAGMDETIFEDYYYLIVSFMSPNAEVEVGNFSVINNATFFPFFGVITGKARKASIYNIRTSNHHNTTNFRQASSGSSEGLNKLSLHMKNIIIQNAHGSPIHTERINTVNLENVLIDHMRGYGERIILSISYAPHTIMNNVSYTNSYSDASSVIMYLASNRNYQKPPNPLLSGTTILNNILIANNDPNKNHLYPDPNIVYIEKRLNDIVLNNWTLANNKGADNRALVIRGTGNVALNNMIFYNPDLLGELVLNDRNEDPPYLTATINNSLFYGPIGTTFHHPTVLNNVKLSSLPQFLGHHNNLLTPNMWEYYFLHGSSPAIDTGIDVSKMMSLDVDLMGNPRVYGSAIDIGAFEYQGTPTKADFAADPLSGDAPLSVQFTDLSTGAVSWEWDFGVESTYPHSKMRIDTAYNAANRTKNDEQHPTFIYESEGVYSVTLTINNGASTITKEDYIIIGQPVHADFSAKPLSGDAPLSVQFTDLSIGAVSWEWDFGVEMNVGSFIAHGANNSPSHNVTNLRGIREQNPTFIYENEGVYSVTLTINNGASTITKKNYIVVDPVSEADETILPITAHNLQNYPNPVNISLNKNTLISFDTPLRSQKIDPIIEIYNIRGQKIKTLRTGMSFYELAVKAGLAQENLDLINSQNYSAIWDLRDENRRHVGAGVYFYRAVVDGQVIGTNRMSVIK